MDANALVGRSPWTARDALVPLPEAEAGASVRAGAPAPPGASICTNLSQQHRPLHANNLRPFAFISGLRVA